jgi:arabinan endo-1,5-alpha-L-arabinosidase
MMNTFKLASRYFTIICIQIIVLSQVNGQTTSIPVHDPVMIKQDSTYYVFSTGWGISVWSSTNLVTWKPEKPVFQKAPEWALKAIPGFIGHIWAPDISFYNGMYVLFYSVSAFGKNTSCIGMATNKTLNPSDKNFAWHDYGKIIESVPLKDDWNAIDPNMVLDNNGKPWLCFGSFWSGIKLVRLKDDLSGTEEPFKMYPIASRPRSITNNPAEAGDGAIEAPFIIRHGSYYYLFTSIDYCCRGVNSNYKIMIGRSDNLTGPYTDQTGKDLMHGGGKILLQGNSRFPGVGHNGICSVNGIDYMVFHAYDASDNGKSRIMIRQIKWDKDGWPVVSL